MAEETGIRSQVEAIRTRLRVNRLHYIYSVRTPVSFREEFHYLFSGHADLAVLPLWWHSRKVQANMVSTDASGRSVQALPSARVREYSEEFLHELVGEFVSLQPESDQAELAQTLARLDILLKFDVSRKEKKDAYDPFRRLQRKYGSDPQFRKLFAFATRLLDYYLPMVTAPKDGGSEYVEVRTGVDLNIPSAKRAHRRSDETLGARPGLWDWFRFATIGSTAFELPVPLGAVSNPLWSGTDSLHLQLNLPSGVHVTKLPEARPAFLFDPATADEFTSVSADYVYSYMTADNARSARDRFESLSGKRDRAKARVDQNTRESLRLGPKPGESQTEGSAPRQRGPVDVMRDLVNFIRLDRKLIDAARPRIHADASVDDGVRILGLGLWVVVAFTYALQILGLLSVEGYIELFAALLLVVLTLAVYSLDKPFVRYPVFSHVGAATVVFFELGLLIRYGAQLSTFVHAI